MKNKFFAPNSKMVNASNVLDNSGVFKPSKKANWSLQRTVPHSVLVERAEKEAREKIAQHKAEAQARFDAMYAKLPVGIHAKTVDGGFKVLGFGVTVKTQDEILALAVENKRAFVTIDGVTVA